MFYILYFIFVFLYLIFVTLCFVWLFVASTISLSLGNIFKEIFIWLGDLRVFQFKFFERVWLIVLIRIIMIWKIVSIVKVDKLIIVYINNKGLLRLISKNPQDRKHSLKGFVAHSDNLYEVLLFSNNIVENPNTCTGSIV